MTNRFIQKTYIKRISFRDILEMRMALHAISAIFPSSCKIDESLMTLQAIGLLVVFNVFRANEW